MRMFAKKIFDHIEKFVCMFICMDAGLVSLRSQARAQLERRVAIKVDYGSKHFFGFR